MDLIVWLFMFACGFIMGYITRDRKRMKF